MDPVFNTILIIFGTPILDPFFNINQHKWGDANWRNRLRNGIRLDSLFWGRPGASQGASWEAPWGLRGLNFEGSWAILLYIFKGNIWHDLGRHVFFLFDLSGILEVTRLRMGALRVLWLMDGLVGCRASRIEFPGWLPAECPYVFWHAESKSEAKTVKLWATTLV